MKEKIGATTRAATIAKIIMLKPSTLREIVDSIGIDRSDYMAIQRYVDAYHDQGVVYISGWFLGKYFNDYVAVFAWQPSPFECADAPKPVYVRGQLR